MSNRSRLERTDATWNPVIGCSRVSPGCVHCYAERLSHRFGRSTLAWTDMNAVQNIVLHPKRTWDEYPHSASKELAPSKL